MFEDFLPGARNLIDALHTPEGKRALLAFGANMMQPVPFGQSPLGQIGQSIGAGVNTYDEAKAAQEKSQNEQINQAQDNRRLDLEGQRLADAGTQKISLDKLLRKQESDTEKHRAYLEKQAEDEAKRDADKIQTLNQPAPDPNQYLQDPERLKRYEENWQRRQKLGTGDAGPAPTDAPVSAPASGGAEVPTSDASGVGATMSYKPNAGTAQAATPKERTFKTWMMQYPDRWQSIQLGLLAADPRQKAWALEQVQRLKGAVVDPDSIDAQMKKDRG